MSKHNNTLFGYHICENQQIPPYQNDAPYLDVIAGCVHKHSTVIPGTRLDTVSLGD